MTKRAFYKIADGLREAIAIARGEKRPARIVLDGHRLNAEQYEAFVRTLESSASAGERGIAAFRR